MSVKWTEEQQKVIDTHGVDVLVSAAAGSGAALSSGPGFEKLGRLKNSATWFACTASRGSGMSSGRFSGSRRSFGSIGSGRTGGAMPSGTVLSLFATGGL